jgi:hypothetical protein
MKVIKVLPWLLTVAISLVMASVMAAEGDTVSLRWALGAIETDSSEPAAIKKDVQLETGAKLKFLVEPLSPGSVYLLLLDSDGDLHVLYRGDSTRPDGSDPAYVPPGSHWFELDDRAGRETFFLLASVEPLVELDALLASLESADAAGSKTATDAIVAEVRRLHKEHRNFARPVEQPVMIGGQTRGGGPTGSTIDQLAVEISAERFYGKTITIDH